MRQPRSETCSGVVIGGESEKELEPNRLETGSHAGGRGGLASGGDSSRAWHSSPKNGGATVIGETKGLSADAVLLLTVQDPVLCDVELPLRQIYYPLGFAVEITTNAPEVLEAAQESWGQFSNAFSEPALQFRVGVTGIGSGFCPPMPACRGWRNLLLTVADAENFAVCDLRRGVGFGWFTQAAVEDRAYLRYNFLEGSVLPMLQHLYLAPVHAACVRFRDRGVLLCGDSGAGKSSLAYACARRGWTFVSDDTSELIRARKDLTVIGGPHQIRLREAAVDLFPELAQQRLTLRATGELAIELPTATVPEISTALSSTVDYIVFLNRREPEPCGLVPIPEDEALPWFEQVITHGEDESRKEQKLALRRLLDKPIRELRYRDLQWAVDRLETMVDQGDRYSPAS